MDRNFRHRCSLARALELLGERWTLLVVRDVWLHGPMRFDDLQSGLGVSSHTLSNRLATLVEGGVLERRKYQTGPDRYEYWLTETGAELIPPLLALTAWGDRHLADSVGPTTVFTHAGAHPAKPVVTCGDCGGQLAMDNIEAAPGPAASPDVRPYALWRRGERPT